MFYAVLFTWSLDADQRLHGKVYADSKKRFRDGEFIVSSKVASIDNIDGCKIAQTKNTRYLLA
jgi:hypothetical protein